MKTKIKTIEYNPVCDPKGVHMYQGVRWVENVSLGLRFAGFADKLVDLRHQGWYTDEYQDQLLRGVVYRLPAGRGFVWGYADPDNEDCALISFDTEADERTAARKADRMAEIFAEEERDRNTAYRAGQRVEELTEAVKSCRKEALAIGAEMRAAKKAGVLAPTVCNKLRSIIIMMYRNIQKMRKEAAELVSDYGHRPGFTE